MHLSVDPNTVSPDVNPRLDALLLVQGQGYKRRQTLPLNGQEEPRDH
jgi:hypothetical protein